MKRKLPVVLVTGAEGQLGRCLQLLAHTLPQYHFIFTNRFQLAIDDKTAVNHFFTQEPVAWCINCAAYTAVDKAESNEAAAMLINGTAVGNLAAACYLNQARFIHISTDYVFNGKGTVPYTETDVVDPINLYGASKLLGEQLAMVEHPNSIIIRTSWVYAQYGHNFVKTMLRLMAERESINVVNDQIGRPTYALDLAQAILHIIAAEPQTGGIYHFSNQGNPISWYDFAVAIKTITNAHCAVNPIETSAYPTPARRPLYSVLDTHKIAQTFGLTIPHWQDSLPQCVALLQP